MTENPAPYGAVPPNSFEDQYQRVLEAAGCRTQVELAAFMDIRQSSISDAKRRKNIPAEWLLKLFEKKRISPEWIRTGQGGMPAQPTDAAEGKSPVCTDMGCGPVKCCTTEELFTELVRRALKNICPDINGGKSDYCSRHCGIAYENKPC